MTLVGSLVPNNADQVVHSVPLGPALRGLEPRGREAGVGTWPAPQMCPAPAPAQLLGLHGSLAATVASFQGGNYSEDLFAGSAELSNRN